MVIECKGSSVDLVVVVWLRFDLLLRKSGNCSRCCRPVHSGPHCQLSLQSEPTEFQLVTLQGFGFVAFGIRGSVPDKLQELNTRMP